MKKYKALLYADVYKLNQATLDKVSWETIQDLNSYNYFKITFRFCC